jgi:hypothetical protein
VGQLFISYSRRDTETVDRIAASLQTEGLEVWIDRQDIEAGGAWSEQIVEAIDTCDAFLLMLSPNSGASKNVHKEVYLAESANRQKYVVMLEKVAPVPREIAYQLAGQQFIDVQKLGLEEALKRLLEPVKEYLAELKAAAAEQKNRQAELVIQGIDMKSLTPDKQSQLLDFIAQLSNTNRSELSIAGLAAGSVHVFVDMPSKSAFKLKTLALNRDKRFKNFKIVSMRLVGDKKFVNISLGIFTATATIGFWKRLWLRTPSMLTSVVGVTIGKALTLLISAAVVVALAIFVPRMVLPPPSPAPTPTPSLAPTLTPTFTRTPTPTLTSTPTITFTATASNTPSPSSTPSPTFVASLIGTTMVHDYCFLGPDRGYFAYGSGIFPNTGVTALGRNDDGNWVYVELANYFDQRGKLQRCWIADKSIHLNGEVLSLEPVYPYIVGPPISQNPVGYPHLKNIKVSRLGDQVTITWDRFVIPEGDRYGGALYVAELWLCQDGKLVFTPIFLSTERLVVTDESGCSDPSHARLWLSEKHGYIGPETLWGPQAPTPTPTNAPSPSPTQ